MSTKAPHNSGAGFSSPDFLLIGGGVIGLNIALEAKRRHPDSRVTLIEKEKDFGVHASGRNSGVLHAGFYYTADSLKARFTREGNQALSSYCKERGLALNRCGKLVVAKDASELSGLDELLRRAQKNGVELHSITEKDAKEIEPRVKTYERAIFSPTTSSINPREVMGALVKDARDAGVALVTDAAYLSSDRNNVRTTKGHLSCGYVVNTAGLYADQIARDFGFSQDYRILPFKGLYLYAKENGDAIRTNIYPVPDLRNPFLGVHYTITSDNKVTIGPTAIPAFWREHYNGLANFRLAECVMILALEGQLFWRNEFGFRKLAVQELGKYYKPQMVKLASQLATGVEKKNYQEWGAPGIRAQLIDVKKRKLEMDFRFEADERSMHVLNAVSPAFTCSMPFSSYIFDEIDRLIS